MASPKCLLALLIIINIWLLLPGCRDSSSKPLTNSVIYTNEAFINGLYSPVNPDSAARVFEFIFEQLDDEVTVYPSENIYYLRMALLGRMYWASLAFYPPRRDSGILEFGYVTRLEDKHRQKDYPFTGGSLVLGKKDGLILKKLSELDYSVSFRNKDVVFHLYPLPDTPGNLLQLKPGEKWLSSTFDESGLQFNLILQENIQRMFWVLREEEFVPESFHRLRDNLFMGDRTGFVFFNDSIANRKILVGVEAENVAQNNWYDGPFDHLPDNRIQKGSLNLKTYIDSCYPEHRNKTDEFGRFINQAGRVAIASYLVYYSLDDLRFIDSLVLKKTDWLALLERMTRQEYRLPPDGTQRKR